MLKQDDASDFIKAMEKESYDHASRGHWEIVKRSAIPLGTKKFRQSGRSSVSVFQMAA